MPAMPAVPDRDDDEAYEETISGVRSRPMPPWSSGDHDQPSAALGPPPRGHPAPRAPALEGLTTTGAGVVGLVGTTLAAMVDVLVSPGLGWIFFSAFVVMSAFVGLRLRGRDGWAVVGVPPLVYIAAAGIAAQVAPVTEGSWVQRTSGDMATAVLDNPYVLLIGTSLAVLAFAYRALLD